MPEHNIVPKMPEMVMKEFGEMMDSSYHEKIDDCENDRQWFRSAMRSLLQQAIEEMPKKTRSTDGISVANSIGDAINYGHDLGSNKAIDDCIAAIKSLQERI